MALRFARGVRHEIAGVDRRRERVLSAPRRRTKSISASAAGPASRRSRSPSRPASSRRTASRSTIRRSRRQSRQLAIAAGDIQCAATTVRPGWCGTRRRAHQADLPARQELTAPTAWRCAPACEDRRPQGQDHRLAAPGTVAVLRDGVDAEEERPDDQDVTSCPSPRSPRRRRSSPGIRRGDDLRAVPVDDARQARGRQDHRHHHGLPGGDGPAGVHAKYLAEKRPKIVKATRGQLLRGARDDQKEPAKVATRSWAPT